jgi:hypothetical protein
LGHGSYLLAQACGMLAEANRIQNTIRAAHWLPGDVANKIQTQNAKHIDIY